MKTFYLNFFILVFFAQTSYSQISNFVLTVTKTDETCTGNGTLTFAVANTSAGSIIIYKIYKIPDVVNTIAVQSLNTFGGLTAGTYRVIATQTLGNLSGTQQQDTIILDTRSYITYQTSGTAVNCNSGTIHVNVLTGNPVSYEIVSGPVTVAPQSSNTFTNLPSGTYNIRVNDACGEGVVQTYTLLFSNPPNLVIGSPATDCLLTSCDTISVSYTIKANDLTTIRYPLTVQLTLFPPANGVPIIQNQLITSGNQLSLLISNLIPLYYGQLYTFNIKVIDACGNIYVKNANQINLLLTTGAELTYFNCVKGIKIGLCNFLPPYNITFLSTPAGFNPIIYNSLHPGPFTSVETNYVSTATNEIPNGTYIIQVKDACNRTATCQVVVIDKEPLYTILIRPESCDINTFIQIPRDRDNGPFISTAIITSSTANLGFPIPYNVTSAIFAPGILIMQLPPGTYTIQGIDACGHPYSYTFTMPPKVFIVNAAPRNITGCSVNGLGGIGVTSIGALLSSIIITQAPVNYSQTLPYDVSFLIPAIGSSSVLIPNLPAGNYTLNVTDSCGNSYIKNVTIVAYILVSPLTICDKKGCGENYDSIALGSPNGALKQ